MQPYEVIEAETTEEALQKSIWEVGDQAVCTNVQAIANSNGTFSVFSTFEHPEERPPKEIEPKIKTCGTIRATDGDRSPDNRHPNNG